MPKRIAILVLPASAAWAIAATTRPGDFPTIKGPRR